MWMGFRYLCYVVFIIKIIARVRSRRAAEKKKLFFIIQVIAHTKHSNMKIRRKDYFGLLIGNLTEKQQQQQIRIHPKMKEEKKLIRGRMVDEGGRRREKKTDTESKLKTFLIIVSLSFLFFIRCWLISIRTK